MILKPKGKGHELHEMDLGTHMHLLEEWNESEVWDWGSALVLYEAPLTTVSQQFSSKGELDSDPRNYGLVVAQYRTDGEGDIVSLYVFDRQCPKVGEAAFNYVGKPST